MFMCSLSNVFTLMLLFTSLTFLLLLIRPQAVSDMLIKVAVPSFTPRAGVRIETNDAEAAAERHGTLDADKLSHLIQTLPQPCEL